MDCVGARARYHLNDSPGISATLRGKVAGLNAELLYRIWRWHVQRCVAGRIVEVRAVQRLVKLVGSRSVHGQRWARARVGHIAIRGRVHLGYARKQHREPHHVTVADGQVHHPAVIDHRGQCSRASVHHRRISRYLNRFADRTDLQLDIGTKILAYFKLDRAVLIAFEAGGRDFHGVTAWG